MGPMKGRSNAFVESCGVQETYDGETLVVKNLNVDIAGDEFLTMFRVSGSGKTTTLMMFAGFQLGLSRPSFRRQTAVMSLLISPMIEPVVITAVVLHFFNTEIGLLNSYAGLIVARATLATTFVVIAVTATLLGFDRSFTRAAAGLGAPALTLFFKIPRMIFGALFAFIASFAEVVALFVASPEQRALSKVNFSGVREYISPRPTAIELLRGTLGAPVQYRTT
ncbi:ABC-type spermidine/putrescine transport system permease subunit II [Bradyrhizobium sp. i1.4.4]